jgi:RluA family pseudouridine synthase
MMEPHVLDEYPDLWVIDKPAGYLSIPAREEDQSPVVSTWLEARAGQKVWVVHRLDRQTSGVMLFAKTEKAHRELNDIFQKHLNKKVYECLAWGEMERPALRIATPIEGKRCLTQVQCVERFSGAFHASVRIETGRQHQIRIHLASVGHPLLGDIRYGGEKVREVQNILFDRVALHARKLELPDGRRWEAPLPEDFVGWITQFRQPRQLGSKKS